MLVFVFVLQVSGHSELGSNCLYYVLVSTVENRVTKESVTLTVKEREYLKKIIELILNSPGGFIKSSDVINLSRETLASTLGKAEMVL